jgi:hypothetical protein
LSRFCPVSTVLRGKPAHNAWGNTALLSHARNTTGRKRWSEAAHEKAVAHRFENLMNFLNRGLAAADTELRFISAGQLQQSIWLE